MSYIGDNLNALCVMHGITNKQLAQLAELRGGVFDTVNGPHGSVRISKPENTVSRWFNGGNVEPARVLKIIDNTGWDWDDIHAHAGGAAARLISQLLVVGWDNYERLGLKLSKTNRLNTLRKRFEAPVEEGGWGGQLPAHHAFAPLFSRDEVYAYARGDADGFPLDPLWVPVPEAVLAAHPFAFAVVSDDPQMYGALPEGCYVVLDHEPSWKRALDYELVMAIPDGGFPVIRRVKVVGNSFFLSPEPNATLNSDGHGAEEAPAAQAFTYDDTNLLARVVYFGSAQTEAQRLRGTRKPKDLDLWASLLTRK